MSITNRHEFRRWLEQNHASATECWLPLQRGCPKDDGHFYYLDAVEEALCFGWIDSTLRYTNGVYMQRFSPRHKNGVWTELNKERVRRLEYLGLMTDAGRKVLPPMGPRSFKIDPAIEQALKTARLWSIFRSFPPLYQRIRAYNIAFYKQRDPETYRKALDHLIKETSQYHLYGQWNDYGRLLDYDKQEQNTHTSIN